MILTFLKIFFKNSENFLRISLQFFQNFLKFWQNFLVKFFYILNFIHVALKISQNFLVIPLKFLGISFRISILLKRFFRNTSKHSTFDSKFTFFWKCFLKIFYSHYFHITLPTLFFFKFFDTCPKIHENVSTIFIQNSLKIFEQFLNNWVKLCLRFAQDILSILSKIC